MIKSTQFEYNPDAYEKQIQYILGFEDTLEDVMLEAAVMAENELGNIYATAPPRGNEKFIWSNDPSADARARGWWFANLNAGRIPTDGRHYSRQGKPPYGALVDVSRDGNNIVVLEIRQEWDKASYVFGSLDRNNWDSRVVGHRRTGWQAAKPQVDELTRRVQLMIIDDMLSRFGRL